MRQVVATSVPETAPPKPNALFGESVTTASLRRWWVSGMILGGLTGLAWVYWPFVDWARAESPAIAGRLRGARLLPRAAASSVSSRMIPAAATGKRENATATAVLVAPADSALPKVPDWVRENPDGQRVCGANMLLVDGDYCTTVTHQCTEPFDDGSGRCRRYATLSRCYPPLVKMRFCIDRFEYPNREGEKPTVMVDYAQAMAQCVSEGKRLCTAREWTLSCEGPERLPYPHGYVRDDSACNIDQIHRFPDADALASSKTREHELHRLDQRTASGTRAQCVSAYGVYDLIGNVDEWVTPDGPEESAGMNARTALKGGYYGPVRARCRPATTSHGATFKYYQVGFRCCAEAPSVRTGGAVAGALVITGATAGLAK